jgi:cyclic pyranopterin monophosphate synthase
MSEPVKLTHFDDAGNARMVEVGHKPVTCRRAEAQAVVCMLPTTLQAIQARQMVKGDVLQVARLAGIMAAKRTDELIPLCHRLNLSGTEIDFALAHPNHLLITTRVTTQGPTGVEMEALVAATAAALTVYDMCKSVDRGMTITEVALRAKEGGKSGTWQRIPAAGPISVHPTEPN